MEFMECRRSAGIFKYFAGSVLLVLIVSIVTVFVSAYLPARKISKIGPIECIRGNEQHSKKLHSMDMRLIRRRGVEGMLARNSLRVQHRKTRGIVRSIVVFAVILVVTSFGGSKCDPDCILSHAG